MVLTDTPVKQMLADEQRAARERRMSGNTKKAESKKGRGKDQTKKARTKGKKKLDFSDDGSDDEEAFCLVCIEPWGTVGQVKNGSDVRSANAGCTRSALAQMELYTYATTVNRVIRTLPTSDFSG